jgi:acylphosphatase
VRGKVQGVCFRAFTQEAAQALGVAGWVRNAPDGNVRARLEHADAAVLQQLIRKLAQGPPAARVTGIDIDVVDEQEARSTPDGVFAVLR